MERRCGRRDGEAASPDNSPLEQSEQLSDKRAVQPGPGGRPGPARGPGRKTRRSSGVGRHSLVIRAKASTEAG